ncbi:hypothetical protein [Comamonas sp.]|uniref:hypothetical protein n=1 Tax=Comamonas sp. TaxID=34028 RepID=UPI00258F2702|nr:hypothetical protein [Comamonas sp.]
MKKLMCGKSLNNRLVRFFGAGAVVALVSGCAISGLGASAEDRVVARSGDFWAARMSGDYQKAYSFTTKGYRLVNDVEKYRLQYGAAPMLKNARLVSVECEPERCEVVKEFSTSSVFMRGTPIPISLSEIWLYQDGQWWLHIQ